MTASTWEGYGVYVVREPQLPFPKPALSGPEDARALLQRCLGYHDREVFAIVLMDARNQVMGVNTVSVGSVSASIVHPREVFKPAILMAASSILLAHCHPSGDPSPSQDDIELTRRLVKAGQLLGIEVLDHIIVADASYCSFKERGIR
jgi:DNA repair protein RadC